MTGAKHGLVFMLAGLSSSWKQIIGYHFTGNSVSPMELKKVVFEIIVECEKVELVIDAIVSDMGAWKKGLWRKCGVSATKHSDAVVSCRHPCAGEGEDRTLLFFADAPHVLKNVRGHLIREQVIYLPGDIVEKHGLPTNKVSVPYIKKLAAIDAKQDLKIAPRLKEKHLDPNHFEKMNVASAVAVLNHAVASAIRLLVKLGQLPREALTTAWFLEAMDRWFTLMTSRSIEVAMSNSKENEHENAVTFLRMFMSMFRRRSIRSPDPKDCFKPVQAGVIISTHSTLILQEKLLSQHNFKFVLLSRVSQDALENLISCVRHKHPIPQAMEFKLTLRFIALSQFFSPSRHGNYGIDDSVDLTSFLQSPPAPMQDEEVFDPHFLPEAELTESEQESLTYLAGYTSRSVLRKHKLCEVCIDFLKEARATTNTTLIELKSYTPDKANPLFMPSRNVLELLQHAEHTFRLNETNVLKISTNKLTATVIATYLGPPLPPCHDLAYKLVHMFLLVRLRFYLRKLNLLASKKTGPKCGSRSVAMRVLAENVR